MFSFNSAAVLAALTLFSSRGVSAQQTVGSPAFSGCVESSYAPVDPVTYSLYIGTAAQCAQKCYDETYRLYSFYQADSLSCYCSDSAPNAGESLVAASTSTGGCPTDSFESYVTSTTYGFQGCYSTLNFQSASIPTLPLGECIRQYGQSRTQIVVAENIIGLGPRCIFSSQALTLSNSAACGASGTTSYYYYTHTVDQYVGGPSAYVKKRSRERLVQEQDTLTISALCPSNLNACIVGHEASFECIDTQYELESCGGCVSGDFNTAGHTASGVDCTALPGPMFGAVTCLQGRCSASACKQGWTLVNDQCVEE